MKHVFAIFRMGSKGWVFITHKGTEESGQRRLERFIKDMPHETFRMVKVALK